MQGLITLKGTQYFFRTDHGQGSAIWAWKTHDPDYHRRSQTYKWDRLPKGAVVETFNLERPPATVTYIPVIQ